MNFADVPNTVVMVAHHFCELVASVFESFCLLLFVRWLNATHAALLLCTRVVVSVSCFSV